MSEQHIVTVNGKQYDTRTGLPVTTSEATKPKPQPKNKESVPSARTVHTSTEKSQTLRRTSVKRPATPAKAPQPAAASVVHPRRRSFDITPTRNSRVTKFAKESPAPANKSATTDIAPRIHPSAVKAASHHTRAPKKPAAKPSAKDLAAQAKKQKEIAVQKALDASTSAKKTPKTRRKSFLKTHPRLFSTTAIVAAMIVIIGSLIWINLPTISVKLASSQAGITAEFPHFLPDGYSLELPVRAEDNLVKMTFQSRSDNTHFSLSQSASSWDSEAVRISVEKDSNGQFLTSRDRGLTIYTYNSNQSAAWVNKGVLYRIDGNATLSSDYVLRIANSL